MPGHLDGGQGDQAGSSSIIELARWAIWGVATVLLAAVWLLMRSSNHI
jgi:hypothetical protein